MQTPKMPVIYSGLDDLKEFCSKIKGRSAFLENLVPEGKSKVLSSIYNLSSSFMAAHFKQHNLNKSLDMDCWCVCVDLNPNLPLTDFFDSIVSGCTKFSDLGDNFIAWAISRISLGKNLMKLGLSKANSSSTNPVDNFLLDGFKKELNDKLNALNTVLKSLSNMQFVLQLIGIKQKKLDNRPPTSKQLFPTQNLPSPPFKRRKFLSSPNKDSDPHLSDSNLKNNSISYEKSSKSTRPFMNPYFFIIATLFAFLSPTSCLNLCKPQLSEIILNKILSNLTVSESSVKQMVASPFEKNSDQINSKVFTFYEPLVSWEGFIKARDTCIADGGEIFNADKIEYTALLEKFRPLKYSFFLPIHRSNKFVAKSKEEYYIGNDRSSVIENEDKNAVNFTHVLIDTNSNPLDLFLVFPFDPNVAIEEDYVYVCANKPGNIFNRKKRLDLWNTRLSKSINDLRNVITEFLITNTMNEDENCVEIHLGENIPILDVPANLLTIDESNENEAHKILTDFTLKIEEVLNNLKNLFQDPNAVDCDKNYKGNFFNMLANLDFSESDDLVFFIFFVLIILLAILSLISSFCISFCRKRLARETLQAIIKSTRQQNSL